MRFRSTMKLNIHPISELQLEELHLGAEEKDEKSSDQKKKLLAKLFQFYRDPRGMSTQATGNTCYFQTYLFALLCKICSPSCRYVHQNNN